MICPIAWSVCNLCTGSTGTVSMKYCPFVGSPQEGLEHFVQVCRMADDEMLYKIKKEMESLMSDQESITGFQDKHEKYINCAKKIGESEEYNKARNKITYIKIV